MADWHEWTFPLSICDYNFNGLGAVVSLRPRFNIAPLKCTTVNISRRPIRYVPSAYLASKLYTQLSDNSMTSKHLPFLLFEPFIAQTLHATPQSSPTFALPRPHSEGPVIIFEVVTYRNDRRVFSVWKVRTPRRRTRQWTWKVETINREKAVKCTQQKIDKIAIFRTSLISLKMSQSK